MLFYADRWAHAFIRAAGDHKGEALELLRAVNAGFEPFQCTSVPHMEQLINTVFTRTGLHGTAADTVKKVLLLLERHHASQYRNTLTEAIQRIIDYQNHTVNVTVETAKAEDTAFLQENVRDMLPKGCTVILHTVLNPALIGGYRVIIGSDVIDASLKLFVRDMISSLSRY
ncbi:MAG: F0F1 ATP synthase subunit delta [Treponema sp.]|jgi:F0F1-type ATP synthase delta subunit|nr:F0F1 ATP synthase subunit delta [Treponema sp.]